MSKQNDIERLKDQLQRGLITADQANVQIVKNERFRLIVTGLDRSTRNALNAAVKNGELEHMKKDGVKPEAYYHPNFKYLAIAARNREFNKSVKALKAMCG